MLFADIYGNSVADAGLQVGYNCFFCMPIHIMGQQEGTCLLLRIVKWIL